MSFKYGVDWDWERSLRKEEIKEAIKPNEEMYGKIKALAAAGLAVTMDGAIIIIKREIIDGFRPVSSGPEWRVAFQLLSGSGIKNSSEVSTGVSKANSSTFSLEDSYKVGLTTDVFSCEKSGKATTTTKVETIMSSSHVKRVETTYEFTSDNSDKQNEVHLYYQLVFIVKYADKKETKLNTNVLRRMVIQDDHKGEYPLPRQSAEDAWANLSR